MKKNQHGLLKQTAWKKRIQKKKIQKMVFHLVQIPINLFQQKYD